MPNNSIQRTALRAAADAERKAGRLSRALLKYDKKVQKGATHTLSQPRCPAGAGLIRSAAHPPYGGAARLRPARALRRSATAARLTNRSTGRHSPAMAPLRAAAGSCRRSAPPLGLIYDKKTR